MNAPKAGTPVATDTQTPVRGGAHWTPSSGQTGVCGNSPSHPAPVPVPMRAERIPSANTPVRLPEVRKARASLIANITVGAVLIVLVVGGIVFYFAAGLAS